MEDRIKNVMSAVFGVGVDEIDGDFSPSTAEVWDSLRHMNLVIALEEEFEIEFDENDIPELLSIDDIYKNVTQKL